jgi:hypothetical protein
LPHPFADDLPPAELLAVPESAGVSVAPVEGQPKAISAGLAAATARALLGHEIPASEKSAGHGSYQLYGRLTQSKRGGKLAVAVLWRLEDAKGREVGERGVGIEDSPAAWRKAGDAMVERLAALSADAVAPLLVKDTPAAKLAARAAPISGPTEPDTALPGLPPPKPPVPEPNTASLDRAPARPAVPVTPAAAIPARKRESGPRRVTVRRVTGAPGDGATSLARAVTSVLRRQDLTIVDPGGKADFTIDGEVSIASSGPNKQHVKIVWHVRNASGAEIGNVGQENDVPRGLLSGSWGDVAYVVAAAAGDGLLQVLARAAPPANPADGTGAAAHVSPSHGPSRPAASAVKAGKTKGQR